MPNVTHLTLEQHLVYTFSKVQDQYGQKLDITSALPTLEQVLKGPVDPTKKVYRVINKRTKSNSHD